MIIFFFQLEQSGLKTIKMNQNFNSNTSEQYSLHISNDHIEVNLPPNALSCASDFEVDLSPTLDLNQLSYLQSTDVEVSPHQNIQFLNPPNYLPPLFSNQSLGFFYFVFFRQE